MFRVMLGISCLIILTILSSARAETINPLKDPNICGLSSCELDNEKFRYAPNTLYKYLYESSFHTLFEGTDNNDPESEMFISAFIAISFPTKCQGQMKMSSVRLKKKYSTGVEEYENSAPVDFVYDDSTEDVSEQPEPKENVVHPRSQDFGNEIEEMDLRFDFHDGLIQEVCPKSDEAVWVTNFKRGILSAFQNTMSRFDLDHKSIEKDVSGKCEVTYRFEGSKNTSILVLKKKDIGSCQSRNKFKSIVQTTPYEFRRSDISWWPIYNSTSFCRFAIDNYIYNEIECQENHVMIPFSNEGSGAVSRNIIKLKLMSETPMDESSGGDNSIEVRKLLLYDHSFSSKPTHHEIKISREYLRQMCTLGFPNIQRDFPDRFVKFLAATKQLSTKGLQQLLARAAGICSNGRKHVLESLPFIGSVASVELMKDLITGVLQSKELNAEMVEVWMNSMFYLPRPEESSINTMFSLIQHYEENPNPIFVLIPSSVTYTFCKYHSDCQSIPVVMNIVKYLEEMATKSLAQDLSQKTNFESLMVALKGLGNIGIFSKQFESLLKSVVIDELKTEDVKLQAIQIFRKTNCAPTRDFFMDIYENNTQSVEIRIASYLQFMKCPSYLTIREVKMLLGREQVNQVGSFVWSHLTNLAKTSSPQKLELQGLLADNDLDEKFKMDFRKFSKNYEYSLFFDEYNFGLSGESNVIFGIESYLPRSIGFNGTINLFGNSVNPFEFNLRIQGMEKYIESIFGLEGPLNFERLLDKFGFLYDKIKSMFNFDYDIFDALLRSRRSTLDSEKLIDGFLFSNKYNFNKPKGYFEHKIFGNDINFYQFEGFDQLSDIIKKLVPMEQFKNIFSNKQEVLIKSGTLVDVSYTVPLSSGFPLVLSGFGAYSLDMQYIGAIKNKDVWETGSLDFTGKLKPSLSMELSTKMQIDLFYASTDVKVKSNIYSNYAIETEVKLDSNTYASLKVKLPQDRNDIFSIRSQLIGNIEGQDSYLHGITNRYMNSTCTWPSIDEMLGLKVCVDYSMPDVSDTEKVYPSLVLSGPVTFDIHLDKADLSAKFYNFEYQWNKGKDTSDGSITFETPNTKIPRQLQLALKTDLQNYNFTMAFVSGDQSQTALGLIHLAPFDKSADFSLNINGRKHFSMELSMKKKISSKSKSLITPLFLLTINDQKVAGMNGIIRTLNKNNVTQHDIDLTFETKNMTSSSVGHIIISETSLTTKMQYNYKFKGKKEQSIEIDTDLANRSQKLRERTEYTGELRFNSSAYKHYNFASAFSFLSSLGHAETKIEVNNAPDLEDPEYTLTTRITVAKNAEDSKNSRTMFAVEVSRPQTKTDLKFSVKWDEHFKNGTEHSIVTLIRYAPDRNIIATASVLLPREKEFGVDARFVLEIPDMNSCTAAIKIKERSRKDYVIDVGGEWFTGENIKFVGLYQDRTSNIKRYYKLKAVVSSKLFEDINCNLKYSRDLQELKLKIVTDYKKKTYSLHIESSDIDPLESVFKTELNWADHSYSMSANSSLKGIGRTIVDIHMDRYRDVHLEIWGTAKRFGKTFGIEFKWDANRDPSQKMIASYEFDQPRPKVYSGNVILSYPERTLSGQIDFSNEGPYTGELKISWGADEAIDATYSIGSDFQDYKKLWAILQVETPFTGWKNNKMNGSVYQKNNLVSASFATLWAEQKNLDMNLFIDYLFSEMEISAEFKASVQTTVKNIPAVEAYFKHNQTLGKVDSEISFRHKAIDKEEMRIFSMKSSWKHSHDPHYRNITGSMKFKSPLVNYQSGAMITKFSVTKERELLGVIDIDIDTRLYSFAIEGYLKRLLDNMITFNLTTPIDTFPYLLGKFGIKEAKRYLIADLKTLNRSLGVEILFDFNSITDLDLKFYIATPQPALEKILAIGKIKDDTIHLEGALNKISLGFKGIWRFVRYDNFEYSYMILTPLQNFEENGLVVKFIGTDIQNFDIESSFKLGKYKLGLKGFGEPRTQLINQLGLQKATYIRENFFTKDDLESEETEDGSDADIDLRKFYGVMGNFELCTILWDPINGNYEVQQVDDTYHGDAKIYSPKGLIEVKNKFVVRNNFNYANRLNINTPFLDFKSIASNFKLKVPEGKGFTARFDIGALKNSIWRTYGFKLSYDLPEDSELKIHDVTLIILHPLANSSRININSRLELAGNSIRLASVTLDGFQTYMKMLGTIDMKDEKDFGLTFNMMLKSPVLEYYSFDTYLKKKTLDNSNKILAGFLYNDDNDESRFDTVLGWRESSNHIIDGDFAISSNIFPIERFNSSLFITEGQEPEFNIKLVYGKVNEMLDEMKFYITKKDLEFNGELVTPFDDYSNLRFSGVLIRTDQIGAYKAKGNVFKNLLPHPFEGEVTMYKNLPTQADFVIKDNKGSDITLTYTLKFDDLKRALKTVVSSKEIEFISFESELYIQSLLDWAYNIKIQTSKPELNEVMLSTTLTPLSKTQFESSFEMITPWAKNLIDKVNVSSLLTMKGNEGDLKLTYGISDFEGSAGCSWKWIQKLLRQDYQLKIFTEKKDRSKHFTTEIGFTNSSKTPTDMTFNVDVNSIWAIVTKARFDIRNTRDMSMTLNLEAPEPAKGTHKVTSHFKGSRFPPKIDLGNADFHLGYENEVVMADIKSKALMGQKNHIENDFAFEWGEKTKTSKLESDFKLEEVGEKMECNWELSSPYYPNEKTLNLKANYFTQDKYKVVHATIHVPESRQITVGDVAFADLANMKGSVNCSLPVFNLTWFDVNFDLDSHDEEIGKFIKTTWPDNYALLDSKSTFVNKANHKEWKGTIKTELPLHSKHIIQIIYGLEEKPLITTGDASVEYNSKNIVNSHYTCKTEKISETESKDIIDLSLENEFRPLGIHFIHQKRLENAEKTEFNKRHMEIFDLSKDNRFNITGEFTVDIRDEKQTYKLVAIHPNRTIVWTSDYSSLETKTMQSSKIELASDIWIGYNVDVSNHTKDDSESQELQVMVSYPSRDISLGGLYLLKDDSFDTDFTVKWLKKEVKSKDETSDEQNDEEESNDESESETENTDDMKKIQGKFQWRDLESTTKGVEHQSVLIGLQHPNFEKDVTFKGSYFREEMSKAKIDIDFVYTEDEDQHATFSAEINNLSEQNGYKNYTIYVNGKHVASSGIVVLDGSAGFKPNDYRFEATGLYKRGYLPEMELAFESFLNMKTKEIKFYRSTPNEEIHFYGKTGNIFPVYSIEGIFIDTPQYETTGAFVLDLDKKMVDGDVNFTEDASQNLQLHGKIPDTRSASFNIWRSYEDIRIDDISYFIQMNHSRLITSKFIWRPKIRMEVKEAIKNFMTDRYSAVSLEMDDFIKTVRSESVEMISGIWSEAKPYTKDFFDDLASLKDIDEDLSAFRVFLNASYYADDFYIQSFFNYTMTMLDELAITDHLQTIPQIFKEMWSVLGESSLAFKTSISWIAETVKASYKESMEMFNQLMQGNSLEYVTSFLEHCIDKYDRFVKDLHVTFMNYIETMYDNLVSTISVYWNRILQNIEPQIIRSIHYIESVLWGISNEIFDFMYNRTNELIESPYFSRVSNITHDLDVLYQDLSNNDMFTNFRKYSGVMWSFLKEKTMSMMPFGMELKVIFGDIGNEFKELMTVPPVREAVERYEEIVAKISWLMNEFQFDKRLNMLIDIIKNKLTKITQNALQTEGVYREAKTKFIFDPDVGQIEWEQKLPMSWHAFNETPLFEEIPEYKMLNDVQSFFFSEKNSSIWNLYYSLKPLSEPQNFVPPFKSHALLVGSRHIITFDNNFAEFDMEDFGEMISRTQTLNEGCSYLLAHDFINNQFSFILKSSKLPNQNRNFLSKTFVIKSGEEQIEIELGNPMGTIHIGSNLTSILPTIVGDLMVTRELNVVAVSSKRGFWVECNLEFDVCSIELSGWFFGKIAGVLGTMNNEKFDDFTMSDNDISPSANDFVESWKLPSTCSQISTKPLEAVDNFREGLLKNCDLFFKQKTSYLATCFTIVNPDSFYETCLRLGNLPRYRVSRETSEKAACTAAIAYIEACFIENVPLRVPDTCIQCKLPNGTFMSEGTFAKLKDEMVIPAVDIVFLMESRACNVETSKRNLLSSLVSSISSELKLQSIEHHRFAVVAFGGTNEFAEPRSITSNGHVFTSAQNVKNYFNHLKEGNGASDVFTAITIASKLIFKPGAVKIFVLSLCTKCEFNLLNFDVKSVSQLLRENDIALHIISDNTFNINKVLGVDATKAYLRKDQSKLVGDEATKRKVTPIKALGQCGNLALETDGSIFTSKTNNKKNDNEFKIIANVFAKKITQNAKPKTCHKCECEGHNTGTAFLTCMSCDNEGSKDDYDVDETLETDIEDSYEDGN